MCDVFPAHNRPERCFAVHNAGLRSTYDNDAGAAMTGRKRLAIGLISMALAAAMHAEARSEVLFQAEAQTLTGNCTGQAVRLEGNHNQVKLSGTCASLLVKGFANTLQLAILSGGVIHVEGAQNHVRYTARGTTPAIVMLGPDNEVIPVGTSSHADTAPSVAIAPAVLPVPVANPPAPLPASPKPAALLTLAGDDEERLADCAGRDALVTGNRSAYVIRGTCRSLVVRGNLLTVQAIMQPAARITVSGQGSVVSWALPGRGHPPVGIVHGAGSRIQHAEPPARR